jgi:transcriptional regulator with XRE-family HTH domain
MRRFGEKLHTLRERRGMSLCELARALGFQSHSHITKIETGKRSPSLELAIQIANLFAVSVDQLVRDDLEVDPEEPR